MALEPYTFAIGNYDTENYSEVTMSFFILSYIFMPFILLNMLIAFMGNTYNVANENAVAIDTSEKISRNIFDSNSIPEALSALLLLETKSPSTI